MTEKNLSCEQLGERVNYYHELSGFMPVKDSLREIFWQDIFLVGVKMVFYEKGLILVDQRLGTFVLPYCELTHLVFHASENGDLWLEIGVQKEGRGHLLPANMLAEPHIMLRVN